MPYNLAAREENNRLQSFGNALERHQTELIQMGLFLDRLWSNFFEIEAHSLIAVFVRSFQFTLPNLFFRHVDDAPVDRWQVVFEKLSKLSTAFIM